MTKIEDNWMGKDRSSVYYMVPQTIIKSVNGSPYRLVSINLNTYSQRDNIGCTIIEKDFNKAYFTVEVPCLKIFRNLISVVCTIEDYEEELYGLHYKHYAITQCLSRYIKKNFQIGECDRDVTIIPLSPNTSTLFRSKFSLIGNHQKLALIDRE